MNLSGIASQFAMQNRSFAMRNWMWFAENCDAKKRSWPRQKKCCLYAISVRTWVHARGLCSSVRSKIAVVRDFLLLVARPGHLIRTTFHVCHTHVVSLIFVCAVLITSCNLRLTEWDVGSSKYFWQVSWVVEVDVERRGGYILKNAQHGLLRWFLQTVQENSSSLHGLQNITTWSAFVDGTCSSTLKELVICGANNEERSGLQKCLTSLHFIAAAEGLSFFFSKFPGLVELGKCHGVQEIFSPKHQKKNCYTNHTNCYAIQFSCRRNCYAKFWQ